MRPKTGVILPTFNEAKNISNVIPKIFAQDPAIPTYDLHALVIDDNTPDKSQHAVRNLIKQFQNLHLIYSKFYPFILLGIFAFIVMRIPSLAEPHWYGDEGIYAAIAQEMSYDEILYKDIWDNKPHLIYWLFLLAGNTNRLLWARIFNLAAGIATIIGIYILATELTDTKKGFLAFFTAIPLLATPLLEGNIANAENFFLPLIVWGLYLGFTAGENKRKQLISGILFGFASLFKLSALLDFAGFILFLIFTRTRFISKKPDIKDVSKLSFFAFGFLIPILCVSLFELTRKNFGNFASTMFVDMFCYVSYPGKNWLGVIFFPMTGKVKLLLLLAGTIIVGLNFFSRKMDKKEVFVALILLFEYMGTLVSSRHYVHYLLQVLPGFSLFIAILITKLRTPLPLLKKINIFTISILGFYLALITFNQGDAMQVNYGCGKLSDKNLFYKIYAYYENYVSYAILRSKSRADYNLFFNNEEADMEILGRNLNSVFADIPRDKIYVYTNRAWTYPYLGIRVPICLSTEHQRYTTKNGHNKLLNGLKENKTQLIVLEKGVPSFEGLEVFMSESYKNVMEDGKYQYFIMARHP
ncbi:MAG: glycosyltransferase [candidate division Zixibacteria bacterium]|nr:glycosyltransferase [Phycisphaerae bacterium]NIR64380.1 glycosyltransferase [candidate division Zixibacteria bacterium]NIP53571.1 glycosyltransferase [Phycisphaerae bacterium]NIS52529.1 glycosyltransferase [Phycisphaerae bacterium]NIU14386.1 glycosyltransferase [candidate division Zixibacteria bacterium]